MVVICLGGYAYLLSIINVNANMLNTLNFVSAVIWVGWLEAFVNFTASVFFLKYYGLGGVALGTFLGALLGPWVWLPFSIVKKSNNRIQYDFKFVFKHLFFIILPCLVVGLMMTQLIHSLLLILIFGVLLSLSYLCLSYLCIPQNIRENLNLLVLWKRRL
jgi:O-antigen/teichoic acid export membrane protein